MKITYVAAMVTALLIPVAFTACTSQDATQVHPTINISASPSASTAGVNTTVTPSAAPSEILISSSPRPTTVATPKVTVKATSKPKPGNTASTAKKRTLLQLKNIRIAEADYTVDYNRTKDFGPAWLDVDHNGCDTRNDILKRDLTNITYRSDDPECTVATGTLHDEYTGKTIKFVRGVRTSLAVQVDHRYPLLLAYQHGASKWSQTRREQFANDPVVLVAVDGPSNEQKSASGPADWMPSNNADACNYVEKFTNVAYKYNLTLSRRDAAKINSVLNTCK